MPLNSSHCDWHHELLSTAQPNVAAAIQVELSRSFAAETKCQQPIAGQKTNRADHAARFLSFGIEIIKFDNVIVAVLHRSC